MPRKILPINKAFVKKEITNASVLNNFKNHTFLSVPFDAVRIKM